MAKICDKWLTLVPLPSGGRERLHTDTKHSPVVVWEAFPPWDLVLGVEANQTAHSELGESNKNYRNMGTRLYTFSLEGAGAFWEDP